MRTWDSYGAYLFDIDGTLLHCADAVHYFGFCEVLTAHAGKAMNLDGVATQGNIDVGIMRDAMALGAVPEEQWRSQIPGMCEALSEFVEERRADLRISVLPGVVRVLEHLRKKGARLGVATGNLERIGWTKLEHCGLRHHFHFGGFSDGYESRSEMVRGAVNKAKGDAGQNAAICVVGDTPSDIRAARANGLDVIAVATGIFSCEELQQERPDLLVRSIEELLAGEG